MEFEAQGSPLCVVGLNTIRTRGQRQDLAANLALALASLEGIRVLLVDAKFAHVDLHQGWNTPASPGLAEASNAGEDALPLSFRKITGTQLYLLPAGTTQTGLVDPINLRGAASLLEKLRSQLDWILIDGPSFESAADAMAISMLCDGTLLLLEKETDTFEDVSAALRHAPAGRVLGSVIL